MRTNNNTSEKKGNFLFLEEIQPVLYRYIVEAETNAYINPRLAAKNSRDALEEYAGDYFSTHTITCYNKDNTINTDPDLSNMLYAMWKYKDSYLKSLGKVTCIIEYINSGKREKIELDGSKFLRMLGNAGSHPLKKKKDETDDKYIIVPTTEAVKMALKMYFHIFTNYYLSAEEATKLKYKERLIPIGKYEILSNYEPSDKERSKCIQEYKAIKRISTHTNNVVYAVIREYEPDGLDQFFLNRNIDTFSEAYSFIYSEGIQVEQINRIDEENAHFFVAYEFVKPVVSLNKLLRDNTLTIKDRILICKRIAESLKKFHNAKNPIYHRLLSYESIMVSDFTDVDEGYRPYITKFDFAKLTNENVQTVLQNLKDANTDVLKLQRYRIDVIDQNTPWDKVDIYSLGVLFIDILSNEISKDTISEKTYINLINKGIPESLANYIFEEMIIEYADGRPSINEVVEVINKEFSKL